MFEAMRELIDSAYTLESPEVQGVPMLEADWEAMKK